jgi:NAD(P)-dependent dehydrogenase (short-subunit alcohol dehydrogenase family)
MNLPYQPDFSGKVAVVTGGAGVLCTMFAKALSQCGARVAILDLSQDKAETLAGEIRASGGEAIAVGVNVLEQESVQAAYKTVTDAFGPCDILVNGAGGNNAKATTDDEFFDRVESFGEGKKSFFDLDPEGFDFVFGLNMKGTLLPTQAFARDMAERGKGGIVNISSMNAFTPLTKIPAYSAAKAAVSNFTRWLAVYFSQSGVRVNAIAPGFFSTQQNAKLLWNEDGTPTPRTLKILKSTPMSRFGEAEELLGALLFLLDDKASSFVTGTVLAVDGGFSAYSGV